jgi:hypothetical protein
MKQDNQDQKSGNNTQGVKKGDQGNYLDQHSRINIFRHNLHKLYSLLNESLAEVIESSVPADNQY